ncbi:MAG TPA: redoxin domain-containing protein [Candidatus Polarisedimenticolia bacterium]|nr:redoxin domain-containing protein [Candidatus Polarisedimenticolia bacterium]
MARVTISLMSAIAARYAFLLAVLSIFTPGAQGGADTDASRSAGVAAPGGMLLAERRGHIIIVDLLPGAAAAAAGLRPGDVVLAVNEVNLIDLDNLTPAAVRELLGDAPSADPKLIIGRGGQTFGVQLSRALLDAPPGVVMRATPPAEGEPAPAFTATDLQGRTVRLDDLRGRPVLLDFWASWCPPCRASAITLKRFADQFGDRLAIIGISLDEDRSAFEAFVYNHHLPGHQIHDGGPAGPITTLYDAASYGLPYSVLIDPDGDVLLMGASLQAKERAISRLLDAAPDGDGS